MENDESAIKHFNCCSVHAATMLLPKALHVSQQACLGCTCCCICRTSCHFVPHVLQCKDSFCRGKTLKTDCAQSTICLLCREVVVNCNTIAVTIKRQHDPSCSNERSNVQARRQRALRVLSLCKINNHRTHHFTPTLWMTNGCLLPLTAMTTAAVAEKAIATNRACGDGSACWHNEQRTCVVSFASGSCDSDR